MVDDVIVVVSVTENEKPDLTAQITFAEPERRRERAKTNKEEERVELVRVVASIQG